ncbi:hypothetical protein D5F01_LYC20793 [Larimichthys crocea]|uniref:Uncharacterized protein n=1 Tax=Larimichthys crocea TaxID=215358 RepID=A0A6G0HLW7_LARCR|nr:hypothetical protein D5F01_LYC20793 [Larimichthys crocea]
MRLVPETVSITGERRGGSPSVKRAEFTVPSTVLREAEEALDNADDAHHDSACLNCHSRVEYVPCLYCKRSFKASEFWKHALLEIAERGNRVPAWQSETPSLRQCLSPVPLCPGPLNLDLSRILGTIPDDLVTLDCLFGVASQGQECCFVQYKPNEKHKKCASLKVEPVQQINMFTQTLRDKSMPIDVCLQTRVPSLKKILWIRVSLAEVMELSLEHLWLIRGIVQLDRSKQRRATITIDDHSLEPCFLDPRSQLLCPHPDRTPTKEERAMRATMIKRDEHHEERDEIAFGVTRKRKVRNVKEDNVSNAAGVPPPHKKSKPPRRSHAVSLDPEPREPGDEEEDKRGCRMPQKLSWNTNQDEIQARREKSNEHCVQYEISSSAF